MEEEKETMASVESKTEDCNSIHDDIICDEILDSSEDEFLGEKSNFHDDSESEKEVEEQSSLMDFEPKIEDNTSSSIDQDSTSESSEDESTDEDLSEEVWSSEEVESTDKDESIDEHVKSADEGSVKKEELAEENWFADESEDERESTDEESTNKEETSEDKWFADEEEFAGVEVESTNDEGYPNEEEPADENTQTSECESDSEQSADDGEKGQSDSDTEPPEKKMKLEAESISTVPQRIISKFYGRQTELEILQSAMDTEEKTNLIDIAITGITGVGKTELVLKFIQDNSDKFKHLIWIDCENMVTFQNKILQLASYLDIIDKEFDITNADDFNWMFQVLYKELNQYKTLIVFDNVHIEIEQFVPSKEKDNIMFIVTSQISDIDCNQKIELECFDHETAIQMLSENIELIDEPNLQKLATALGYHPLALDIVIKYYKYQIKMLKLENGEFCVQEFMKLLTSDAKFFINFKDTTMNSNETTLYNIFKCLFNILLEYDDGKLAVDLLCFVSYMGNRNIDVRIFNKIPGITNQIILSSIEVLTQFSLVTVQNLTVLSAIPIIRYIIRSVPIKDKILDYFLEMLQLNMRERNEGITLTIDDDLKPHVMKIFNRYATQSRIQEYGLMFLESSYIGKEFNYDTIHKVYTKLNYYNNDISIDIQCLYIELLIKCKKYEEVIEITDKIIKNNDKKEFDNEIYGLIIWYYRSYALYALKEYEKSWKICKWTFIRMSEHFDYTNNTLKCLCLLIEIAMKFEDVESHIDYCKNLIEHIIGTYIDWSDTLLNVMDIQLSIMYIILYFIKSASKPDIALEFIKNLKSRLEIQMSNNVPNRKAITIIKFLKFYKCTCLFELNKYEIAYNKLLSLFDTLNGIDDNTTISIMLMATTLFNLKNDNIYKIKGIVSLHLLLINKLNNEYVMGVFRSIISIIKYLQCTFVKIGMVNQVIQLYDTLEKSELNVFQLLIDSELTITNKSVILGRLEKALFICEYVGIDEAWDICTNILKNTNCPQAVYNAKKNISVKPSTKTHMKMYILAYKKHIESILKNYGGMLL